MRLLFYRSVANGDGKPIFICVNVHFVHDVHQWAEVLPRDKRSSNFYKKKKTPLWCPHCLIDRWYLESAVLKPNSNEWFALKLWPTIIDQVSGRESPLFQKKRSVCNLSLSDCSWCSVDIKESYHKLNFLLVQRADASSWYNRRNPGAFHKWLKLCSL